MSASCSIAGCGGPAKSLGWCSAHYQRWRNHGDPLGGRASPVPAAQQEAYLRDLVAATWPETCIVWPYSRTKKGYGLVTLTGVRCQAHRAVCRLAHGEPPTGSHQAAHSCGQGHEGCINPGHLRWATPKENAHDQVAHGTDPQGERNAAAILSEAEVLSIYGLKGRERQADIARRFDVSQPTVADIHRGGAWAWLTGAAPFPGKVRGSRHHASKLTVSDVIDIRAAAARGEGYRVIAKRAGVTPQSVRAIATRTTWAWLADERSSA